MNRKKILFLFLIACLLLTGCRIKETSVPVIKAYTVYSEYVDNPIAADQQYKGKLLAVSGYIAEIGRDTNGSPYVLVEDSAPGSPIIFPIPVLCAQCIFSRKDEDVLAMLKKGDSIIIAGKGAGFSVFVFLTNCYVAK